MPSKLTRYRPLKAVGHADARSQHVHPLGCGERVLALGADSEPIAAHHDAQVFGDRMIDANSRAHRPSPVFLIDDGERHARHGLLDMEDATYPAVSASKSDRPQERFHTDLRTLVDQVVDCVGASEVVLFAATTAAVADERSQGFAPDPELPSAPDFVSFVLGYIVGANLDRRVIPEPFLARFLEERQFPGDKQAMPGLFDPSIGQQRPEIVPLFSVAGLRVDCPAETGVELAELAGQSQGHQRPRPRCRVGRFRPAFRSGKVLDVDHDAVDHLPVLDFERNSVGADFCGS